MKATFEHIGKKAWLIDNSWSQDIVTGYHPHLAGTSSKKDIPVPLIIVSLPYKKVVDGKHEYEFIDVLSGESIYSVLNFFIFDEETALERHQSHVRQCKMLGSLFA